jgi:hypothetical protein
MEGSEAEGKGREGKERGVCRVLFTVLPKRAKELAYGDKFRIDAKVLPNRV